MCKFEIVPPSEHLHARLLLFIIFLNHVKYSLVNLLRLRLHENRQDYIYSASR